MNLQTFKMLALNILCFICYLLFFIWLSLISNLCSNNDSKRSADSFCVTVVWLIRVLHPRLIIKWLIALGRKVLEEQITNINSILVTISYLISFMSSLFKSLLSFRKSIVLQISNYYSLRTSEIHLFYNLQVFYWHFLEILWLFIFLVLYFLESFISFMKNLSFISLNTNLFWVLNNGIYSVFQSLFH